MKIVTVEVEVKSPNNMDEADVSAGIDHMLDAGATDMLASVLQCTSHPVIDDAIAVDCVALTVGDSEVVSSMETEPPADDYNGCVWSQKIVSGWIPVGLLPE